MTVTLSAPGPTTTLPPPLDRRRTGTPSARQASTRTSSRSRRDAPRTTAYSRASQNRTRGGDLPASASRSIAPSSARSSATLDRVRSWQAIARSTSRPSPRGACGASGARSAAASEFRLFDIDAEDGVAIRASFLQDHVGFLRRIEHFLRLSLRLSRLGGDLFQLLGALDECVHEFIPFRLGVGLSLRPAQGILDWLGLLGQLDQLLGVLLNALLGLLEVGEVARPFIDVRAGLVHLLHDLLQRRFLLLLLPGRAAHSDAD